MCDKLCCGGHVLMVDKDNVASVCCSLSLTHTHNCPCLPAYRLCQESVTNLRHFLFAFGVCLKSEPVQKANSFFPVFFLAKKAKKVNKMLEVSCPATVQKAFSCEGSSKKHEFLFVFVFALLFFCNFYDFGLDRIHERRKELAADAERRHTNVAHLLLIFLWDFLCACRRAHIIFVRHVFATVSCLTHT